MMDILPQQTCFDNTAHVVAAAMAMVALMLYFPSATVARGYFQVQHDTPLNNIPLWSKVSWILPLRHVAAHGCEEDRLPPAALLVHALKHDAAHHDHDDPLHVLPRPRGMLQKNPSASLHLLRLLYLPRF